MARRKQTTAGEWQAALKRARAEDPAPVTIVHGGQEWFRRETVETLLAAFRAARPEAGVAAYQGPASPSESPLRIEAVLGELVSHGLFATEKLVVVRRADRFLFPGGSGGGETDGDGKSAGKRDDPLADYVADPTDGMYLLLECERLDRRTKRGKALVKHGLLLDCPELRYERDTLPWLRGRARDRSLDLTPDAARMLFTIHGAEPGVLAGELEKLALFAAGAGQIDEAAVRTFMGDAMALSFFELSNAVEARDPAEALTVARRMIRQGLTDQRGRKVDLVGAVHMAMGSLRSTLATLWRAHDVAARGGGPSELEPHLGGRAWRAEAILRAGERYRLDEIRRGFDALTEALAAIHDTGGDPALALERTVLTICGGDRTPGARAKEPA